MTKAWWIFWSAIVCLCGKVQAQPERFYLTSAVTQNNFTRTNWKFRRVGEKEWKPATVPGTVHTDLWKNNMIPDPFAGDNEKKIQWIEKEDWEYKATFRIPREPSEIQEYNPVLVFEGLDTYAKVTLNGSPLLEVNNMFRTWKAPVGSLLKAGENELSVRFYSASDSGFALRKQLPHTLPGEEKVFTRKAQYQYGWDWGPRFVTAGIWKNVYLDFQTQPQIDTLFIHTQKLSPEKALMKGEFSCIFPEKNRYPETLFYLRDEKGKVLYSQSLSPGNPPVTGNFTFEIQNPEVWQPEKPVLIPLTATLESNTESGKRIVFCRKELKIGIQQSQLVQEADSKGKSFYLTLNGKPVFIKGANWIPAHSFPTEVKREDYLRLLLSAKQANINLLRVWGGGYYEDDVFYELCDSLGIMVWQDFMFACAMYPGDAEFLSNVKAEATEQIIRLRNHPCIVLWCGNNEIDEGWHNWGWQKVHLYSRQDSQKIWSDYLKVFEEMLPGLISAYDVRPYHPSSPANGWGRDKAYTEGDVHYWGVWWGLKDYKMYGEKVGRFVSEYGMQGFPDWETVKQFAGPEDLRLKSPAFRNHQKHPTGFLNLKVYTHMEYRSSQNLRKYAYTTQLMQADAIRTAILAYRRAKPYCMGTIYWQFNDCWPVISWSGMDFYGRYKALQYAVKEAYAPVAISALKEKDELCVYVLSDVKEPLKVEQKVSMMDFEGKVISFPFTDTREVPAEVSTIAFRVKLPQTPKNRPYFVLITSIITGTNYTDTLMTTFLSEKPNNIRFPNPRFSLSESSGQIRLISEQFAKGVHLYVKDRYVFFEKNYFDLPANIPVLIPLPKGVTLDEIEVESYR